ncbi:MAG: 50S ribosomal protein L6 [Parcubacteria group bacterium]|nr:50S ribosomal protein L6 [Parcubacteria group bacterium]
MSRIGKRPIPIPEKTEVTVDNHTVVVRGPLGETRRSFTDEISIEVSNGTVVVTPRRNAKRTQALWGTYAAHVKNMLKGVNVPYAKELLIEGVGYRAEVKGKSLVLQVGFSHPVSMPIPPGISVAAEKNSIRISGIDKEAVGQFAANIRAVKKPEPYKGKGIRYAGEIIRRKVGKKAA